MSKKTKGPSTSVTLEGPVVEGQDEAVKSAILNVSQKSEQATPAN